MANERFIVRAQVRAKDSSNRFTPSATFGVNRIEEYEVKVPAGQCAGQVLSRVAISSAIDEDTPQFIKLHSNLPYGVSWWPIHSSLANVKVDPLLESFGSIVDWRHDSYNHDHSAVSSSNVDHGSAASIIQDTFPHWWSNSQDRAAPTTSPGIFFSTFDVPSSSSRVGKAGKCADCDFDGPGAANHLGRTLRLNWGMQDYMNFGAQEDGLGFMVILYAAGTNVPQVTLKFYSYPYTTETVDIDLIPATTPIGDTVWSSSDRNLDKGTLVGATAYPWMTGGAETLSSTPAIVNEGYHALWFPKTIPSSAALGANHPLASITPNGTMAWSRVTAMDIIPATSVNLSGFDCHIVDVRFCPRPGLLRELRPFDFLGLSKFWPTSGTYPAIGLRNTSDIDAKVKIAFGTR